MTTALPPVAAEVAAAALDLLPARLRKRVDATVTKAAAWPVEPAADGPGVRVLAAEDTTVTLTTTDGVVATADAAVCTCLLAPACLHRAAVLSAAPLAADQEPAVAEEPAETPTPPALPEDATAPVPDQGIPAGPSPAQLHALGALQQVGERVLAAGVGGTGAVVRAELVRAAHGARVAGLHRAAAVGLRIAQRVAEARADDPGFRLDALAADLAELFTLALRPADAAGTARRAYRQAGQLRLTGLFTEPVVTASGYAGVATYALAPDGTPYTLADVRPGGPERVPQAAAAPVPGGCALSLRELGDGGGVLMTAPAVSHDGRVGGGAGVRSVSVQGTGWSEEPAAALWRRPPAEQFASVDTEGPGEGLLFLDGTLTSSGLAVTDGPTVALYAPDERPELPYAENLRLLAAHPGLRIRLIARVVPGRPGGVHALAAQWTDRTGAPLRADLGLRRIHRADLPDPADPGDPADSADADPPATPSAPVPALPLELELLRRAVERAVAGGRAVGAAGDADLPRRLRAVGLGTGAECARALRDTAADHRPDALGRMVPADPTAYARAWLTAAVYVAAATRSCLAAAWAG
ncbi:hypothetical protein ACGFMM_02645 [Streptomyces sp. NPDC048604]|uniref:hypothetical protein n=1 Tax=Streptomyces sp. NPDC048604 TaxID=3365578 RepID=UPI003711CA42